MDFFWPLRHQSPRRFKSRTWNESNESLKLDELLWKSGVQNHCVKSKGAEQFELYLRCHSNRIAMILVHGGGHFCCVPRLSSWHWKKQTTPNNPMKNGKKWEIFEGFRLLCGTSLAEICIRSLDVLLASQELMKSSVLRQQQYYDSMLLQWQMNDDECKWINECIFFEVVWPAFSCSMRIGRGDFRFFGG